MRGKKLYVLVLIAAMFACVHSAMASRTVLSIEPGLVFGLSSFSVDVVVTDVINLYGYQFEVRYDTDVLTATAITMGDFLGENEAPTMDDTYPDYDYFVWDRRIMDGEGAVYLAVTLSLGTPPPGISGSGILCTIDFSVDAAGESIIDITNELMNDWVPTPIDHATCDGWYATEEAGEYAVSLRTGWVEDRHYVISKDPDGIIEFSAMVKNKGTGTTLTRAVFCIMDEELKVVDTITTDGAIIQPNEILKVTVGWYGYSSPSKYNVEIGCEYIDATGSWVGGLKGSPSGHREVMAISLTVED